MAIIPYFKESVKSMVVLRAIRVAFAVGLILNLINQGGSILNGFHDFHYIQFFLTFMIPYIVSTYSTVMSRFNFVSGEVANVDAKIYCQSCRESTLKVLKGDIIPYCHKCQT